MNIQDEVQKIHHQYGTTEKANYEIQKLFDAELKKMYSKEEMIDFSQWTSHNDWVFLPSKGYWVNEEQEELEQKLSSKEILNIWFEQFKKKVN